MPVSGQNKRTNPPEQKKAYLDIPPAHSRTIKPQQLMDINPILYFHMLV